MTTVLTAVLMQKEWPIWAIVLVVLLSGAFIGFCNGMILNLWKIESFVVTMGMQVVCFGLALLFSDSRTVIVDGDLLMGKYVLLKNLATSKLLGIPIMFIILIVFYLVFYFLSKNTKLGRYIFALGGSEEVCYNGICYFRCLRRPCRNIHVFTFIVWRSKCRNGFGNVRRCCCCCRWNKDERRQRKHIVYDNRNIHYPNHQQHNEPLGRTLSDPAGYPGNNNPCCSNHIKF